MTVFGTSLPYMVGFKGERIDLLRPDKTDIHLETIAYALAHTNRFGGHTRVPYSVAAHSIHVSLILERDHGKAAARVGLMHDAHEAYVGDMPTPIKKVLGDVWAVLEGIWQERIGQCFGLDYNACSRAGLKYADLTALATERDQLCVTDKTQFDIMLPEPDKLWECDLYGKGEREPDWANAFLARAESLGIT